MENRYLNSIIEFKELFVDYLDNIFAVYEHELRLRLEEYNILSRKDNNVESSTAIGFILEEFVISKLSSFTNKKKNSKLRVCPAHSPHLSYDCVCNFKDIKFLINIKSDRGANDSVAAISKLVNDYCNDIDEIKSFVICKIFYDFKNEGSERKILIKDYDAFAIEEVDFSNGHKQDNRNWTENGNKNSGRLKITKKYREDNKMSYENVSFENTKKQLEEIFKRNDS